MRGSVYYQTGQLAKAIYSPSMDKQTQKETGKIANANTIGTYREVWNELGNFAKEQHGVKDLEKITPEVIKDYMQNKLETVSEQRAELINSAIGKLETALEYHNGKEYDFSIRQETLNQARENQTLKLDPSKSENYSRAYENPQALIQNIKDPIHQLAAKIQVESGTRLEGVKDIYPQIVQKTANFERNGINQYQTIPQSDKSIVEQLQGIKNDKFTNEQKGQIITSEKGGKVGVIQISPETYKQLENHIQQNGNFKIDPKEYRESLKEASKATNQAYNGTHGLRWNFAQARTQELQEKANLEYNQALQQVSYEMKHERADITEHYLR